MGEYELAVSGRVVRGYSSVMQWLVMEAQWMEDVVWKSDDFAKQFVVGSVTQFLEWQQNHRWATSVTTSAVDHGLNSQKDQATHYSVIIIAPGLTYPCPICFWKWSSSRIGDSESVSSSDRRRRTSESDSFRWREIVGILPARSPSLSDGSWRAAVHPTCWCTPCCSRPVSDQTAQNLYICLFSIAG